MRSRSNKARSCAPSPPLFFPLMGLPKISPLALLACSAEVLQKIANASVIRPVVSEEGDKETHLLQSTFTVEAEQDVVNPLLYGSSFSSSPLRSPLTRTPHRTTGRTTSRNDSGSSEKSGLRRPPKRPRSSRSSRTWGRRTLKSQKKKSLIYKVRGCVPGPSCCLP